VEKIKIGDICKVINPRLIHTPSNKATLKYFDLQFEHLDLVDKDYLSNDDKDTVNDRVVRVLDIGTHIDFPKVLVAVVETMDNPVYLKFLIQPNEGLMSIDAGAWYLGKYSAGKPLKEKVPDDCVGDLLIDAIIERNPMDIQYVNTTLLTNEQCKRILRKDGGLLGLFPVKQRTSELCRIAVKEEPYAEKFIPERFKSVVNN